MSHNNQEKIAVINDFLRIWQMLDSSSTANSLCYEGAVLSAADLHFSNHTGFPSYFFEDYTSRMVPYMQEWKNWISSF